MGELVTQFSTHTLHDEGGDVVELHTDTHPIPMQIWESAKSQHSQFPAYTLHV